MLEVNNLVKGIENKYGSRRRRRWRWPRPRRRRGAVAVAEEKTEFNVILAGVGEKKIQVIKEVRAITGWA